MGKDLFNTVISATGLPEDVVGGELHSLISSNNKFVETMTLEDLREIMAEYLQNVLLEAKEQYK